MHLRAVDVVFRRIQGEYGDKKVYASPSVWLSSPKIIIHLPLTPKPRCDSRKGDQRKANEIQVVVRAMIYPYPNIAIYIVFRTLAL